MKENFEESLLKANEIVKKYEEADSEEGQKTALNQAQKLAKTEAGKGVWANETGIEVIALQKKKHNIMNALHEKFQAIDRGESVIGFGKEMPPRGVEWDEKKEKAIVTLPTGKKAEATIGEILTDPEWGVVYELGENVPREIKKRFIADDAKREILSLADEQIAKTEMHGKPWDNSAKNKELRGYMNETYKKVLSDRENNEIPHGIIAEKIVKTFFQKIIIDSNLPLVIENVDVYEDIEAKIDFLIRIPKRARGVNVSEDDEIEDVGIQFTTNTSSEMQQKKRAQIENAKKHHGHDATHFDDIVLVTLPMGPMAYLYINWMRNGMPPGGPTKKLEKDFQEKIFRGVLNGLVSPEQIEEMMEIIEGKREKEVKQKFEYIKGEEKPKSEPTLEDEEAKKHIEKFNQKFGKWFDKKK